MFLLWDNTYFRQSVFLIVFLYGLRLNTGLNLFYQVLIKKGDLMTSGTTIFDIIINSTGAPMSHRHVGTLKAYSMITCKNQDIQRRIVADYAHFLVVFLWTIHFWSWEIYWTGKNIIIVKFILVIILVWYYFIFKVN